MPARDWPGEEVDGLKPPFAGCDLSTPGSRTAGSSDSNVGAAAEASSTLTAADFLLGVFLPHCGQNFDRSLSGLPQYGQNLAINVRLSSRKAGSTRCYLTTNLNLVSPSCSSSSAESTRGDLGLSFTDPPLGELMMVPLTEVKSSMKNWSPCR